MYEPPSEEFIPSGYPFHLRSHPVKIYIHILQGAGGNPRALSDQAQQKVLCPNKTMTQSFGLFLGQHQHLLGPFGKTAKHEHHLFTSLDYAIYY